MSKPLSRFLLQNVLWKGLFYSATFILNILIARHFQAETSGSVYYLINIFALVNLVLSLSLESGLTYFGAKREIGFGKLLGISLVWTIISASVLYIYTRTSPANNTAIDQGLFANSILFFVIGNMLSSYGSALFYSQNNFVAPNIISMVVTIILIILLPYNNGSSVFSLIDHSNYFYIYFFAYLVQGITILVAFALMSKDKMDGVFLRGEEFSKLLRFSLHAWIGNIIFFLLYRIDYWFVEAYCTPTELGNYIQVSKLGQLFFLIPSIFAGAIFPLTAAGNKKTTFEWLAFTSRIFIFIYSIICLLLVLIGGWLFPFVLGPSFSYMHRIFILFVPGILALSTLYAVTAYNGGNNKIRHNIVGSLIALIFVVAGNMLLVPKYGVLAAAAICSAGYILYQCYLLYQLKKTEHIKLSSFFLFQTDDLMKIKSLLKRN